MDWESFNTLMHNQLGTYELSDAFPTKENYFSSIKPGSTKAEHLELLLNLSKTKCVDQPLFAEEQWLKPIRNAIKSLAGNADYPEEFQGCLIPDFVGYVDITMAIPHAFQRTLNKSHVAMLQKGMGEKLDISSQIQISVDDDYFDHIVSGKACPCIVENGNHRLQAARNLGINLLFAMVYRTSQILSNPDGLFKLRENIECVKGLPDNAGVILRKMVADGFSSTNRYLISKNEKYSQSPSLERGKVQPCIDFLLEYEDAFSKLEQMMDQIPQKASTSIGIRTLHKNVINCFTDFNSVLSSVLEALPDIKSSDMAAKLWKTLTKLSEDFLLLDATDKELVDQNRDQIKFTQVGKNYVFSWKDIGVEVDQLHQKQKKQVGSKMRHSDKIQDEINQLRTANKDLKRIIARLEEDVSKKAFEIKKLVNELDESKRENKTRNLASSSTRNASRKRDASPLRNHRLDREISISPLPKSRGSRVVSSTRQKRAVREDSLSGNELTALIAKAQGSQKKGLY